MSALALRAQAEAWLAAGVPALQIEVVETQGSVPREAGTHMLVSATQTAGTLGGGHLEWQAVAQARERLDRGLRDAHDQRFALGPSLGQCCGGVVHLRWVGFSAETLATWPRPPTRFHLQLYGAGHVGRAIVDLLTRIDCRVDWIDEREDEFPREPSAAHIRRVCVDTVEAEVAHAEPGGCFLVLTHRHDLDLRITEAVLRRGDFAYLGLIGSATKRARFLHRLEERGVPPQALARLTCPIGMPGVRGKEPEVLAVAVVAQLLSQPQPSFNPAAPPG